MKINPAERALVKAAQQCSELLLGSRVLVCSGSRLVLTSLCLCTPLLPSVVGGATTEDEAMELYEECQPDILITGELLEKGYGIRLVERVKKDRPEVQALIFFNRETLDVV